MNDLNKFQQALKKLANPEKARILTRFFKTGPGEYGEGDKFLGIVVPQQRALIRDFLDLDFSNLQSLLNSDYHEARLCALLILVAQYQKADEKTKALIFKFYLKNKKRINNWDLVDLSAPQIVGDYLLDRPRAVLDKLLASKDLWSRRIAVLATFTFIRRGEFEPTLNFVKKLFKDPESLLHKASGWMLREIGKRDEKVLTDFLDLYYLKLPRTALRYSIERLSPAQKRRYLKRG